MDQFINFIIENNHNPATKNINSLKMKEDLNKKNKELERMKHRLEMQQKKLTELKDGDGEDSKVMGSLKTELEELKAKLSDYEIIGDDIANLSKYKAENEQLMEKLSKYEPVQDSESSQTQTEAAPENMAVAAQATESKSGATKATKS